MKNFKQISSFILFVILFMQSIFVRFFGLDYISADMEKFLIPWYSTIKETGGLQALSSQIGDYNVLYQTIIALLTYVDVNPLYLIKGVSVIFDVILAIYVSLISKKIYAFFVVIFIPTIVFNSAFWGQCDSIYTTFCIATLYYLRKEKYAYAFSALGLGFACKLQTIFLLPFICAYCFRKMDQINPCYYLLVFVAWWMSGVIAYLFGRDLLAPFTTYFMQLGEWPRMYVDFPSFWAIFGQYGMNYELLRLPAIFAAFLVCFIGFIAYPQIRNL